MGRKAAAAHSPAGQVAVCLSAAGSCCFALVPADAPLFNMDLAFLPRNMTLTETETST